MENNQNVEQPTHHYRLGVKINENVETGHALLHALNRAMGRKGHSIDEAAKAIGVATSTLRSFGSGNRNLCDTDRDILSSTAKYLGIPVASVYLMAGALRPQDFFHEDRLDGELALAHQAMQDDPVWAGHALSKDEFDALPQKNQILIALLYQSATSQRFLTGTEVQG